MAQTEANQWYVINALHGNALNAQSALQGLNIECFVPMEYRPVRVKGLKVREQLQPILINLIFIKSTFEQIKELNERYKYLHFSYTKTGGDGRNKPIVVPPVEMEQFIEFIGGRFEAVEYIDSQSVDIKKGETVEIIDGPFKGKKALFVSVSGKRFKQIVVAIDGIIAVCIKSPKPWSIIKRT